MKQIKSIALMRWLPLLILAMLFLTGCRSEKGEVIEVPSTDSYSYINPDETKAETDAGIVIDGVLEEEAYKNNNWLYLHNDEGGNNVNIAMTSHFGQKGMYFVFDVTESVPIYVNLERASYMNSCIEIYLSAPHVTSMRENDVFEIDLMPTGDMLFKRSNGRDGYSNVATTDDIMACLGTTTKGGAVNTADCYGYCMELFIPWDYLRWLKMDVEAIQNGYVYINPAHITSYNLNGTEADIDRYWYHYVQQNGVSFSNVSRHFRFNGQGVMGSVPLILQQGEHYTISGAASVIPGMNATVTIKPDEGYALTSVMLNDEEQIRNISFNKDGSVTLTIYGTKDGAKVSAKAEAVTEGTKTLSGKVVLNNIGKDSMAGLLLSYIGPKGEKPLEIDSDGNFELKDMEQGYYILKAEKENYTSVSRSIYLNQDFSTELVLEYNYFQIIQGSSWILDEQNNGILYKKEGYGQILSNPSYNNFTFRANLKYDPELAKLGTGDDYTQQRTGMQIRFSNGKTWHIDMLKEKDKYILQYAKISGEKSVTDWKTVHTLDEKQIGLYTGKDGIELSIMRQGNYAAIWLEDELIKVEILDEKYGQYSAQLGFESWAPNRERMAVPFRVENHSTIDIKKEFGQLLSDSAYGDFTLSIHLRYDLNAEKLGTTDEYTQQRTGVVAQFSNGKNWHIHLLKQNGEYILQYAKISGDSSVTDWKTVHTLDKKQIGLYTGKNGIGLRIMRQGNYAAIWLEDELIKVEILDEQYDSCSVKLGYESWAHNRKWQKPPFRIENRSAIDIQKKFGQLLSDSAYGDFTLRISLNYDLNTEKLGTTDEYTQQRTGVVAQFSNGKNWHIHLLKQNGEYILQYAKISGDSSVTDWKTVHTLDEKQIGLYTGKNGIGLRIMRQGNYAAIWLEDELIKVEILDEQYDSCSVKLGYESWAYNRKWQKPPFQIENRSAIDIQKKFGQLLSDSAYGDFTLRISLNYDLNTEKLGTTDEHTQQRTGVVAQFSNGKNWHIHLLKKDGEYILQYAKISGDSSVTDWKTIHTLDEDQIGLYTGKDGIGLRIMRQGNYAAIWLGDELIRIEILDEQYDSCSVKLGYESWAYNRKWQKPPFQIEDHSTVDVKRSPFLDHAQTWNVSGQYQGTVVKNGTPGVYTWLESVIITNDVSTIARDLSPDTRDYSLAYIFKFSNNEQFRVRLHHTDSDGAYRIQTLNGSTVAQAWKVGYTLTDAQAAKIKDGGIEYRVRLEGTSACIYLDGEEVCTYDLSRVVATGEASGVDKATAKVSFSLDGNYGLITELPFEIVDTGKDVKLYITDVTNGTVVADKESCKIGDTVTLTVAGDPGYYYTELCINGEMINPNWDGSYSFKATENIYIVTGNFAPGKFRENKESSWNVLKQNQNLLYISSHASGDSGWLHTEVDADDIYTTVKDHSPAAKNFSMIYHFDFSNGETLRLGLNHTDDDGRYRIQVMDHSTVAEQWKSHYTLTAAEEEKVKGDGIKFRTLIEGTSAIVYLDDNQVCSIDLSKVISTGNASGVEDARIRVAIRMDGNLNKAMEIPFKLMNIGKRVLIHVDAMTNGKVTTGETNYQLGDTVTLTVTPDNGYSQKLYINGEPLLLDWKTNTYSFVATEKNYSITGSFEPSLDAVAKDANRWDTANQAHGVLNAYYPNKDDAWIMEIGGEYKSISVKAKNYLPGEDGTGVEGFAVNLGFKLSNGKEYIFRIIKEKGKYYHQRFGINGNDWKKTELDTAAIEALCGDGVNFKLERTSTSTLTLSVNGVVYDNYIMTGVTVDTKVTTAIIGHYGNKGEKIALPFVLKTPADTVNANLNIAETVNGTVTAGQENYQVGDTVILTVTPDAGYALKSLVVKKDGQPVEIGSNYSFVIEDGVYTVEAEFIASMFKIVSGNWDLSNQFDGVLTITAQKDGTTVLTNANSYREVSVTVKDYTPSKNTDGSLKQGNFSMQISFIFDNGKEYQVRMHNTDKDGNYKLQNMGGTNSLTGWKWQADLTTAQKQKLLEGDGVEFTVKLVGSNAELYVDGTKMATVALGAEYAGKTAQIKLCMNGNKGVQNLEIPFALE